MLALKNEKSKVAQLWKFKDHTYLPTFATCAKKGMFGIPKKSTSTEELWIHPI